MIDDKNQLISDRREPYFYLPKFITDELYNPSFEKKSKLLKKYNVEKSIYFSAQGGVYLAVNNGQYYVIKEARKYAGLDSSLNYATERLKKEYTTMKLLKTLDCVPMPVEIIEDFGNVYLVEEYIEGEVLSKFPFKNSPLIKVNKKDGAIKKEFTENLMKIISLCLQGISKIHNNGIILNDISPNNIIYNKESSNISFVDYEVVYHILDKSNKFDLFTPGFMSNSIQPPIKQDLHKLGLVFISCIMPFNEIFNLSSKKKKKQLISLIC